MESKEQKSVARTLASVAEEHIARCKASGKTQVAYCAEYGIKKATFAYWLKRQKDAAGAEPGRLVRIATPAREDILEISYTNGVVVRFSTLVDPKYVKELIG
jgi:transposase-like protein